MVLRKLLLAVCVKYIIQLEQLLCHLQDLVIECKPGVLTDDTQDLRIPQAAASLSKQPSTTWRQDAPATSRIHARLNKSQQYCHTNAVLPAKAMQS